MQAMKTAYLCLAALTGFGMLGETAQANPFYTVGSTVNTGVSYATSPFTGYAYQGGVARPLPYGIPYLTPTYGYPYAGSNYPAPCTSGNCPSGYSQPNQPTQPTGPTYAPAPSYVPQPQWQPQPTRDQYFSPYPAALPNRQPLPTSPAGTGNIQFVPNAQPMFSVDDQPVPNTQPVSPPHYDIPQQFQPQPQTQPVIDSNPFYQ